mmetsp:Transcript_45484/g.89458  ORF Transcript_45484/g.89458 Transcript_45484/m.89458 type:complete len:1147 (-) Transcript_45484:1470-4910(-)|eukprot:CAMPEP_0175163524 /NCGR_PEP_ID=MMETSP0087-20121206/25820_1 /TAXON_ID=136419 /ORGANISM="Unknown Unknown, Strain D1" /LENGTH=1146 /DNA_ID=CAMNT_0016452283 /DNA_START=78 /DNA_END=3515 /DNA_ORIENTATION=-
MAGVKTNREYGHLVDLEAHVPDLASEFKDGEEKSYIPLDLAKTRVQELATELAAMKQRHLGVIEKITNTYEELATENRDSYQEIVDQVKARASKAIQSHKKTILQLAKDKKKAKEDAEAAQKQLAEEKASVEEAIASTEEVKQETLKKMKEIKIQMAQNNAELKAATDERDSLVEAKDKAEARVSELEEKEQLLEQETAKVVELEKQLEDLKSSHTQLAEKAEQVQADSNQSAGAADAAIAEEVSKLKAAVTHLEQENAALKAGGATVAAAPVAAAPAAASGEKVDVGPIKELIGELEKELTATKEEEEALKPQVALFKQKKEQYKVEEAKRNSVLGQWDLDKLTEEDGTPKKLNPEDYAKLKTMCDLYISNLELRNNCEAAKKFHEVKKAERASIAEEKKSVDAEVANNPENEELKAKVAELEAKLAATEQELRANIPKFNGLKKEYQDKEKERTGIMSEFGLDKIKDEEGNPKKMGSEDRKVLLEVCQFSETSQQAAAELKALHAELTSRNAALKERKAASAALEAEVEGLKQKLSDAESNGVVAVVQPTLAAAPSAVATVVGNAEDSQQLKEKIAEVSRLQDKIKILETQLETQNEMQNEAGKLSADAKEHAKALQEKLAAQFSEKTANLEQQSTQALEDAKNAEQKAAQLQELLDQEKQEREEKEKALEEATKALENIKETSADAVSKVEGLNQRISECEKTIEEKQSEIATALKAKKEAEEDLDFQRERIKDEIKRRKEFQFKYEEAKGKIRVYARVRPMSRMEKENKDEICVRRGKTPWVIELNEKQKDLHGKITDKWREFVFDAMFLAGENGTQEEVFEETKTFGEMAAAGVNACIFAYGQSGTGKTFTMAGVKPDLLGLKPRFIDHIFEIAEENKKEFTYEISCYMVEIYLNKLEDLFWKQETAEKFKGKKKSQWPEPPELKVRVDKKKKVTIDNVVIKEFTNAADMHEFTDAAEHMRRVRATGLNEESSRSHLIFSIIVKAQDKKTGKTTQGKLSLADLAGSERADKTNVEGLSKTERAAMMEEGVAINESLRMLKNVFRVLGTPEVKGQKKELVQYRGNMLTELMQDSLGGMARTLMFVNVGPAFSNIAESVDSLQYGDYVKNITNEVAQEDEDNLEQIRFLKEKVAQYKEKFGEL